MTDDQIALVQTSFAEVAPISEQAAALFYGRLFEIAPEVRSMFSGDMVVQGRKLMKTLKVAVDGLNDLDRLAGTLRQLGTHHARDYGVVPAHYGPVGEALLWTLEQGLGDDFTPEVRQAWTETYGLVSTTMIEAAEEVAVAAEGV